MRVKSCIILTIVAQFIVRPLNQSSEAGKGNMFKQPVVEAPIKTSCQFEGRGFFYA